MNGLVSPSLKPGNSNTSSQNDQEMKKKVNNQKTKKIAQVSSIDHIKYNNQSNSLVLCWGGEQ